MWWRMERSEKIGDREEDQIIRMDSKWRKKGKEREKKETEEK